MRAVNLLPHDTRTAYRVDPLLIVAVAGSAVVLLALLIGFFTARAPLGEKRAAIAVVEAQLGVAARPPSEEEQDDAALAVEQEARSAALEAALSTRVSWDRVLRRLSLVVPEDVWLTGLTAGGSSVPAPDGGAAGQTVFSIQGYTYSHDGVARLLARLAVLPDLKNIQLQNSTLTPLEGRNVVQFGIAAEIRRGTRS